MSDLDAVYAERNAVALAFAAAMEQLGYAVGYVIDPAERGWPVLLIDTPHGQVSWHLKGEDMPGGMPGYPGRWDGHSTPEKYARLARMAEGAWPSASTRAQEPSPYPAQ